MSATIPAIKRHYQIDHHVYMDRGEHNGWVKLKILPGDQEWFLNGNATTRKAIKAMLPKIMKEGEADSATWGYQLYEKTNLGVIKV